MGCKRGISVRTSPQRILQMKDVSDLILKYVAEFRSLEMVLAHFKRRYDYIDVEFETLDDVVAFLYIMRRNMPDTRFVRCIEGCNECDHQRRNGRWTYIDTEPIQLRNIVHFIEQMRSDGLVCRHEMIEGIICSDQIAYIQLRRKDA